jgi:type IV pilus assembly protein PilA
VLKHLEKRRQKNEEEGFTLIELMVVVLIMGILMAIAIPTFLSTRGSANDAAAKSNATNAFTNEKSYYSSNLQFEAATAADDNGPSLDSTLPWGDPTATGSSAVAAYVFNVPPATGNNAVIVASASKSGACFYIADVEQNNSSIVGYYATKGACLAPSSSELPTAQPAQGTSSGVSGTALGTNTWTASW